jgi:hypothetical protein
MTVTTLTRPTERRVLVKFDRVSRALITAASSAVLAVAAVGCGTSGGQSPTGVAATHVATPSAAADLDRYRPGDVKFFNALQVPGALMAPAPPSIAEGVRWASVVVLADIEDVRYTRTIGSGAEAQQMLGLVLRPSEVLQGKLEPSLKEVVVEFMTFPEQSTGDPLKELRASLPQGKAVYFLRWKGQLPPWAKPKPGAPSIRPEAKSFYDLIHLDGGILMQGQDTVVAPTVEDHGRGKAGGRSTLRKEAEKFQRMSDFVAEVRKQR